MLVTAVVCAVLAATLPAIAQNTGLNPVATATSLTGTAGQQIIASNPTRRSIRICNTGATNAVWIWPGSSATTLVSDYVLAPVTSNVPACYTPPTGVVGATGAQWNAKSSGGTSTVSVEEW